MLSLISILLTVIIGGNKTFDAQLKNYLDARLKSYVRYEYQIIRLPNSYSKIEIDKQREFKINKNYGFVPVDIYTKQNLVSTGLVTVRLKLFKEVLVASEKINREQTLAPSMFAKEVENVANFEGSLFINSNELSAYRSKLVIRKGAVLINDLIEPVPVVNVGDKMILHTGRNGVDVSIDVNARQEGCVNDIISVQSEGKIFKAKIIDQYNLMLEE